MRFGGLGNGEGRGPVVQSRIRVGEGVPHVPFGLRLGVVPMSPGTARKHTPSEEVDGREVVRERVLQSTSASTLRPEGLGCVVTSLRVSL